jgi:hypothetical protein
MPAITILSLGATLPFKPSADDGIIDGIAIAPATLAPTLKNSLRVMLLIRLLFICYLLQLFTE